MVFVEQLKSSVDIVTVIGEYLRLRRAGTNRYMGLCPFHNEKSPSFTVNEEKGFYHCFGCGAHGSAIDFVMNMDKLSFPEAVERASGRVPDEPERLRLKLGQHERCATLPNDYGAVAAFIDANARAGARSGAQGRRTTGGGA